MRPRPGCDRRRGAQGLPAADPSAAALPRAAGSAIVPALCAEPGQVPQVRRTGDGDFSGIGHYPSFPARAEAGALVTTGGLFSHLAVQKPRAGRIVRPFA